MTDNFVTRSFDQAAAALALRRTKSSNPVLRQRAQKHLSERLGRLKGLPLKLGQMMGMAAAKDGETSQDIAINAKPIPLDKILGAFEGSSTLRSDGVFESVDVEGFAGSVGQVHRARLKGGEDQVALKVLYPGIRSAIRSDLRTLGWLAPAIKRRARDFDLDQLKEEVVARLEQECDLRQEAKRQSEYAEAFATDPDVVIPRIHRKLCSKDVLVSDWEDGEELAAIQSWNSADRKAAARVLLRHFLNAVFRRGLVHGDLHPGNFRFRRDGHGGASSRVRLVLYDFGAAIRLDETTRRAFLGLIDDTMQRRGDPSVRFRELGFREDLMTPIEDRLPALCSVLFEPFAVDGEFDLATWNRKDRVDEILGDLRWNLRMAGPPKLLPLMRAYQGLICALAALGEPVNWKQAITRILDAEGDLSPRVACRETGEGFSALAQSLRVQVSDGGKLVAALTFPAAVIERLETLIDPSLRSKIEAQGIVLQDIVSRARRAGYAPIELLQFDDVANSRHVRLWLE
ncbi:MAG: AarF/UbiB family protein [Planctomycetota bacterium]